jgi:acetyl esterase
MAVNVRPAQISASIQKGRLEFADRLEKLIANDKSWYEFPTPQDYRDARLNGTNGFKAPVFSDKARLIKFNGREGNWIELRVIKPTTGPSKSVWLHFHAGEHDTLYQKSITIAEVYTTQSLLSVR